MRTRLRTRGDGSTFGGIPFFTGALSSLLRNRAYIGEFIHKGVHHPGEHAPIIDAGTFEAAQQRLATQCVERRGSANTQGLLRGLIFDSRGNRMSPSHTVKHGVRYPYYVSRALLEHRKAEAGDPSRVSAIMIDALVSDALRQRGDPVPEVAGDPRDTVLAMVERVELHKHQIVITFASATADDAVLKLPWASRHGKPERTIHDPVVTANSDGGDQRRDRLVRAIAHARSWLDDLIAGRVDDLDAIAVRQGKSARNIRMMIQLAFLDPALIERAIDGRLPATIGATEIVRDLPMVWSEQRQMLGV